MDPQSRGPGGDPWGAPSETPRGMPPAGPAPQAEVPQPPSIRAAVNLMYLGAALAALSMLLGFTQIDELEEMIAEDNPSFSASEVDAAVTGAQVGLVVGGAIAVGLWIWMAIMNGKGKSWARIVGTVFAGINVVSTLFTLGLGRTPSLNVVLSIVSLGLAAVIVVLMFQPPSSRYYEMMSRPLSAPYGYPPPGYRGW